jgi:glutaminase
MADLLSRLGIATFSTRLDKHGTSVRGVRICKRLSDDMGLHIMHAPEPARSVVRRHYRLQAPDGSRTVSVLSLQGTITFTSAERVIRALSAGSALNATSADGVVLDLRQVYSVDNVARRITRESVKRLRAAGYVVYVIDPEGLLRMVAQDKGPDTDGICDASVNDLSTFDSWKRLTTPPMMRRLTSDRALPRLADKFKMSPFS